MIDLTTKYLGLTLKNPLIVGSSELTNSAEKIQKLAAAGAGAVNIKIPFRRTNSDGYRCRTRQQYLGLLRTCRKLTLDFT